MQSKSLDDFVLCRFQLFYNFIWQFKPNVEPTKYESIERLMSSNVCNLLVTDKNIMRSSASYTRLVL